ncbi:MAG: family 1 glycosylhydrolase, partial [bacterium]
MKNEIAFPEGFIWGTASAGHQIEGHNDKSDWWKFEQEGKVYDGTVSGRAVDYWNRYEEDHELMSTLGYQGFRLGIEWAKIEPEDGRFDMDAVEHYRKILQSLRDRKIKICLTLYHWVLPLWFADKGGWEHKDAVDRFIRYSELIVKELGEFPDLWVTLNEPGVPPTAGLFAGIFPPEKKSVSSYAAASRALLKSHARCYKLIHDMVPNAPDGGPTMVGVANAYQYVTAYGSPNIFAAYEKLMAPFVAYASYIAWDYSVATGWILPPFGLEFVPGLKGSYDFCGVNYYTRMSLKFDPSKKDEMMIDMHGIHPGIDVNQMGWENYPPGYFKTLKFVW